MADTDTSPAATAKAEAEAAFAAKLAEFSAKFPDAEVEQLNYPGGRMIVRTPDEGTYAKFIAESSDNTKRLAAMKAMCRRCILWPDLAIVDDIFARKPGLVFSIGNKLSEKAGVTDDVTLGK